MTPSLHRLADLVAASPFRMAVILTLVAAASAVLAPPPSQAEANETLDAVVLVQRVVPESSNRNDAAANLR